MKEAILEPLLRKMRLSKVLPSLKQFHSPKVLDIGCGWEARLLKEIEPFIALGIGIDFKAPHIKTEKLYTFSYFFEPKDSNSSPQNLDIMTQNNILGLLAKLDKNAMGGGGHNLKRQNLKMIHTIYISMIAKIIKLSLCHFQMKASR